MSRDVIALWCHTGSYAGVEWPSQLFFNGFHFKPPGEGFIYGLTGAIYDIRPQNWRFLSPRVYLVQPWTTYLFSYVFLPLPSEGSIYGLGCRRKAVSDAQYGLTLHPVWAQDLSISNYTTGKLAYNLITKEVYWFRQTVIV